jgi:hypothetical protein
MCKESVINLCKSLPDRIVPAGEQSVVKINQYFTTDYTDQR